MLRTERSNIALFLESEIFATNDNAASAKLAISRRAGLRGPWPLLAHLDVGPATPAARRLVQEPHRPADPKLLDGLSTRFDFE